MGRPRLMRHASLHGGKNLAFKRRHCPFLLPPISCACAASPKRTWHRYEGGPRNWLQQRYLTAKTKGSAVLGTIVHHVPAAALSISKIKFISRASKNAHAAQGAIDSESASEDDGDEKDAERSDDCRRRQQGRWSSSHISGFSSDLSLR